ncbi:hypothetical protein PSH97_22455 [Pseudomonas cucumis]|uniref:Uncharacterized protein n=1 Tax=Pseudomonas cucumis TaxID=2954082 RepID=A0ABY9EUA6_9PSED|nr:hypothetical protein [Pseudomonas cucumis]WLG83831.1 hypothetical protein PSH97_22455 [Pseudomonas cucumis]
MGTIASIEVKATITNEVEFIAQENGIRCDLNAHTLKVTADSIASSFNTLNRTITLVLDTNATTGNFSYGVPGAPLTAVNYSTSRRDLTNNTPLHTDNFNADDGAIELTVSPDKRHFLIKANLNAMDPQTGRSTTIGLTSNIFLHVI